MLRRLPACLPLVTLFPLALLLPPCAATQSASDRFDLRGKVINSVTGEPVTGALVQLSANETQFSQSDGSFVFTDLPRGQLSVVARKPGFFSEQDLVRSGQPTIFPQIAVPAKGDVIVKLIPEGIIFGQVKNENGEPLDAVTVRAQRRQAADGRTDLQSAGETTTDDEGNFRIAELPPGNYYLAFLPANRGGRIFTTLQRKTPAEEGYGLQFYPGASDVSSAVALAIHAGAQLQINHTYARQRVFEVAGIVRPANPEKILVINLINSSGEPVPRDTRVNLKTGEFQIPAVPAGTYLLSATAIGRQPDQVPNTDFRPSIVTLPIHVNADLSGLVLNLGSGIAVGAQLRDETRRDPGPNNVNQVFVSLVPRDFPNSVSGLAVPAPPGAVGFPTRFENLAPGVYAVAATPMAPGYVASLRCGSLDLLRDDLTIASGSAPPPIEVTLRSDSAQITVTLTSGPSAASLVVYSQEYPRRSILAPIYNGNAAVPNLAPGAYQLLALKDASELEYRNPAVMEKYLVHAISVALQPGDNAAVRLEIQEPPESRP
jgi:hypothetical protein